MIKKLFFISFLIFFSNGLFAYNYEYKSDDVSISLKFNDSEICYQRAISLKPDFLEAYVNLARTQRELRNFEEAEKNLRIAQKLNPDFIDVNALLGLIQFDRVS